MLGTSSTEFWRGKSLQLRPFRNFWTQNLEEDDAPDGCEVNSGSFGEDEDDQETAMLDAS